SPGCRLPAMTSSCQQAAMSVEARTLQNPENPPLNLGLPAFLRFKLRVEVRFETAITVRPPQPFRRRKGVLLVGRSPFAWERPVPERRVDLRDHRAIGRQAPTVERPEMHAVFG